MAAMQQGLTMGNVATLDATDCVGCYAENTCDSYCCGVAFSPAATKSTTAIVSIIKQERYRIEWIKADIKAALKNLRATTDVEQRKFTRKVLKVLRAALKR